MTYSLVENGNVILESPFLREVSEEYNKRYYIAVQRYLEEFPSCLPLINVNRNCIFTTIIDFSDISAPCHLYDLVLYVPEVLNDK